MNALALPALTPRQTKLALDLLTAGVVISVAFALAGLTWRIAGHAGVGAVTVPSGRSGPAMPANTGPAIALAPFGKGVATDASQPTALPLVLQGIVAAQPASASTAFIVVSGQPAAPFQIGQSVGGATIQGILRDRVILSNQGRLEYLTFPDPNAAAAQAAAAKPGTTVAIIPGQRPGAPASNPPPVAPPPNPAQSTQNILQRFNATPVDGGYRIGSAVAPGINAGDILLSVNGTPLSDPTAAGAAFTAAQQSGSATIQILRDGKRMTLTVPLR
ncbi:signaling protein [Sphingomonas sp. LB-2]|uniref:type II secretion system protein N n=1 Tax=Sphingomonas caeni TaxID=2984949 RepID=UPI0022328056|nr:type II secretion system protein N [Sphingomonas caeni]MCW3847446.1 signaling protein [Sphingomonas caeni]